MIVKALQALALSVGFTLLLLVIYAVHARSFPVGVIFYSAILDAVIACAGLAVMAWLLRRHLVLTGFECGLLVMIWLLGGYAFAISGPTVLDRSLSFYILEKLPQRGGGIERAAMERVFVEEYIPEYRLMDVRMTEQLQSGTIEIRNGCVMLTPWGERLATISHFIRRELLARKRLLAGVYTDTLTDPFRNSPKGPQGYECHAD